MFKLLKNILPQWELGRQGTGYYKLKLFESKLLKMDIYLLRFPENSYLDRHIDPVEGYKHHRVNIIKPAKKGGLVGLNNEYDPIPSGVYQTKILYKFRPDIQEHCVTEVEEGTRLVLSIGWLSKC